MKCKDHPKYKAVMRPKGNCIQCWKIWVARQREKVEVTDG